MRVSHSPALMIIVITISFSSSAITFPNAANQHPQSLHQQGEIDFRSVHNSESYQQLITIYDLRSTIRNQQSTTRFNGPADEAACLRLVRVISNAETMTHKSQRGKTE